MKIKGKISFEYRREEDAKLIFDSLEVDNENYLESEINNKTLNYNIISKTPGSFLATVDDLIASEIVCEKIIENSKL